FDSVYTRLSTEFVDNRFLPLIQKTTLKARPALDYRTETNRIIEKKSGCLKKISTDCGLERIMLYAL
ncbi:hypothetical protein, partial [Legionella spiritensis]